MTRFKRIKDGVVTNAWQSDFAGADYVEPGWGDPSSYQIISEDMTAELALAAQVKADQDQAQVFLKGLKRADLVAGGVSTFVAGAIMHIVKHIRADQ